MRHISLDKRRALVKAAYPAALLVDRDKRINTGIFIGFFANIRVDVAKDIERYGVFCANAEVTDSVFAAKLSKA